MTTSDGGIRVSAKKIGVEAGVVEVSYAIEAKKVGDDSVARKTRKESLVEGLIPLIPVRRPPIVKLSNAES
jgi:hypothetical protein